MRFFLLLTRRDHFLFFPFHIFAIMGFPFFSFPTPIRSRGRSHGVGGKYCGSRFGTVVSGDHSASLSLLIRYSPVTYSLLARYSLP